MQGHEDFDGFYLATRGRVVGHVYLMTGDFAEAEEAVQEAYCRAWQRWPRLRGYADPEGWVRTVAYRVAVSSWRRAVRRLSAHRRYETPDTVAFTAAGHLEVLTALRVLPPEQRRVIALFHLVDLSIEEIARETGVAVGTVKSRLSRARRALAPHLSEFADDHPHAEGADPERRPNRA